MAYVGKAANVASYCDSVGRPMPPNTNPADYMLDLINKDFSNPETVDAMVAEWKKRSEKVTNMAPGELGDRASTSCCTMLSVLFRKSLTLTMRDLLLYSARTVSVLFMCAFFAVIYIEQRQPDQDQVFNRFCFLFWLLLVPSSMGVTVVYALNLELQVAKRETKDGMYSSLVLALVKMTIEVPMMLLMTLCGLVPAAYPIANFEWSTMGEMIVVCTIQLWSMECLAEICSLGDNAMLGMLNFLQGFNTFMLFCGLPLQPSNVIWVFRWCAYVSPLRWGLTSMTYFAFRDMQMNGAYACPPNQSRLCYGRDFFCNSTSDPAGLECYGRNGREVLATLGERFELLTPDFDWQLALVLLAVTTSAFKMAYIAGFYFATHKYALPLSPEALPNQARADDAPTKGGGGEAEMAVAGRPSGSFSRLGATLEFTDVSYAVKTKTGTKVLLRECSARVPAGEVLALMGPSGAGKTTLLNALSLTPGGGTAYGKVTLNGQPFTLKCYKEQAASVAQHDTLWAHLTVREHLAYATALMQPTLSKEKSAGFVEEVMKETGMERVAEVKAGNAFFKGISGGQKRRLSLGVALCKKPHLVFLDEPTSGLDAAAAASIMAFLKATAIRTSVAIICTIHQPSSSVFAGFDSVCFLTGGNMAFVGKAGAMTEYVAQVGKPMPPNVNPADYMLDLINKDFNDPATVDFMVGEWKKRRPTISNAAPNTLANVQHASIIVQTKVLFEKHLLLTRRDPLLYLARMVIISLINIMVSILYIEGRERRQERALGRFFYLFFIVALPGMFSLTTVPFSNIELKSVKGEVKDGAYPPLAYGLVTLVIQVPFMFALGFCACFPGMYPIMDLAWEGFGETLLTTSFGLWAFDASAQLLSVIDNPLFGMMTQMNIWFFSFTFAGIWLPVDDIIWPFRAMCYILPYRWELPAIGYSMMAHSPPYDGAFRCDPLTSLAVDGPLNGTAVGCNGVTPDDDGYGFYCGPEVATASCYGRTGDQILDSFGFTFKTIKSSPEDFWIQYALLLVAMAVTCKVFHIIAVIRVCSQHASVLPPSGATKDEASRPAGASDDYNKASCE